MVDHALFSAAELRQAIESKQVDFGKQSSDYARFRPGFKDEFLHRVHDMWLRRSGQSHVAPFRVLDVASGPGICGLHFCRLFAQAQVSIVCLHNGCTSRALLESLRLMVIVPHRSLGSTSHLNKSNTQTC